MANRMYLPLLPELIDDLVIEILARLPVKLLLQFKCVSKSWCSLIESDAFISTHFRKHQSSDKLVLLRHNLVHPSSEEERGVLSFHDMDSPQLQELWPSLSTYTRFPNLEYGTRLHRLLGPCNGLVLVVDRDDVFVCNPSLRELKLLPRCPFSDPRGYYKHLSDNNLDVVDVVTSGWGFGSTNAHDFNVVQLQCCYRIEFDVSETCSLKAHLYESATSSWKDLGYVDTMFTHIGYRTSELFFNGAFHWHTDLLAQGHPGVILTFDINTGIFGQMEYRPKRAWEYSMSKILLVLNDCLALFWCTAYVDDFHGIWIMKEYGNEESWSPLIAIGPQTIERPLLFWENEVLIENGEGQLASCSLDTNKIERFPIHGVTKTFRAVTYKESLISLKTRQSVN